ncbi:hypothetical protein [Rhodopirellula sp. SWK7]|uniref:hypothetical protein n=1 Tax=Rhodopirellula sp. SWK7 TaxID=595460 RepID=UPI0002BE7588|nr:hypothetical protein [Rhodopirellula sp. SWK7]EMI44411.1 signal peptide protein [Rhodopirellula sp. SWK7]
MHHQIVQRITVALILLSISAVSIPTASAESTEVPSLMTMILLWQYPDSTLGPASMSDAATMNADGQRTCQSITYQTTMVTEDSVEDVLKFFAMKLNPKSGTDDSADTIPIEPTGRSVVVSDDSADRPFTMHTILVNTSQSSTTLIITRGNDEAQTHIAWKHYRRLPNGE